ncbi:ScbA/BarX family gamma-butyrolactone biosynthesis protein [Kitasatospora kifunensis]|uniref:3-hydroxymyristoyl/3-hydroxydecanoyl-(Acyl carrier protein) dehydratase n=1 Tax=Kitasatospora kifunensis TaxID=58351 RepID=A0A7W7QYA2_KITKI|nr:ScbA/BarX family gamma-butyrolactone biosynthesis protein [Kitasatospora kifunensis]MBB4922007.1 3-hydroxymyristoyl/3-hydroxydecanoyl-(acyl carrier protein) dehydratase [Kitasatospora kifunensis]
MKVLDRELPELAAELSFLRTVDRALLHRRNLTEVFLTDVRRVNERDFLAAAQLPRVHPHFTGHLAGPGVLDAMLLLECCRQAETYAAHALFGVAMDASFVLRDWDLRLDQHTVEPAGAAPHELIMLARTGEPTLSGTELRGLDYTFDLWIDARWVGTAQISVGYVPKPAYRVLRSRKRNGPPPSSDEIGSIAVGTPVEPNRVGRLSPTDVVLLDADARTGPACAVLRVPVENPSMFDHAQDHVPGMVLVEAARQLGLFAAAQHGGPTAAQLAVTALNASFTSYAELDNPVTLTAERVEPAATDGTIATNQVEIEVAVLQREAEVSRVSLTLVGAAPESGQ